MCFCKREAVKDIWKIDEQPDVSTISSEFQLGIKTKKQFIINSFLCSVTFKLTITIFQGHSLLSFGFKSIIHYDSKSYTIKDVKRIHRDRTEFTNLCPASVKIS